MAEAIFGESYAIELWERPLADNNVGRETSGFPEDLYVQLNPSVKPMVRDSSR
jgi:hypothetical protein